MHPYLIDLGRITVPWLGEIHLALPTFGVLVASGLVIAWLWFLHNAKAEGIPVETAAGIAFWMIVGGLVGGKLGLVLVDLGFYAAHPSELFSRGLWTAAGVIWSAVLGGLVTLLVLARRRGVASGPLLDSVALPLPLAQAIGRLGCLLAGCCYGDSCQLPWAVVYDSREAGLRTGVPLGVSLHPTPIYEAIWSIAVVLPLLLLVRGRRRIAGEVALAYLVLYGSGRFVVEFFRGDTVRGLWFGDSLSTSQIVSLVVVPLGALLWVRLRRLAVAPPAGSPTQRRRASRTAARP